MSAGLLIHIRKTHEDLARFAAGHIADSLSRAINVRSEGSLVLSGGETPRRVYQLLGSKPFIDLLDWNRIHCYFGDERMVPPDDADSNYGMARRELIEHVPIPPDNVHRIRGELPPEDAAREYSNELRLRYKQETPRFDCVLLGIGEDGHTASLFPGTSALDERKELSVALFVPRLRAWRVTLTFPVINNAREIIVLAEGTKKASVLKKVIGSVSTSKDFPMTMVRPHDGELHWILDSEAASFVRP